MKKAIIIFQKNKEIGKVKTRLAIDVGNEKALEIYSFLTNYTHEMLAGLEADKFLYFSEYLEDVLDLKTQRRIQHGHDLGSRMYHAFKELFELAYDSLVIIGTDCYELEKKHIEQAFSALQNHDVVIGPALDGGYYLLGCRLLVKEIFLNKNWSTETVCKETIDTFERLGLRYQLLDVLSDIDTIGDLKDLKQQFGINKV